MISFKELQNNWLTPTNIWKLEQSVLALRIDKQMIKCWFASI